MSKQFIQVGDINMHYELADYTEPWSEAKPETFLLHSGYCRNMEFWRKWVPLLGLNYCALIRGDGAIPPSPRRERRFRLR